MFCKGVRKEFCYAGCLSNQGQEKYPEPCSPRNANHRAAAEVSALGRVCIVGYSQLFGISAYPVAMSKMGAFSFSCSIMNRLLVASRKQRRSNTMWRRQGARTALSLRTPAPIFSSVLLTRPDFAVSTSTDLGRLRLTFDRLYRRSGAERFSAARSLCTQASSQHTTPNTTKDEVPDQKEENQQHSENELQEIEEFLTEEGYNEDGKKLLFTGKLFSPVQKLKIFSFSSLMLSITLTPPFIMWQTNLTDGAAKGVTFAGMLLILFSVLCLCFQRLIV